MTVRSVARPTIALVALALAALPVAGCASAVKHPALTAGIVGGTLGFGTCKLASDSYPACLAVGGGAGAFLAIVAATAIWLGGEGNTVMVEEQAQPLPDARPRHRRPAADDTAPAAPPAAEPAPANPATASPPASPPPANPPPSPPPASPPPSPPSASPSPSPPPANPPAPPR